MVSQISDTTANVAITYDNLGRVATRSHTVNGQVIYSIQFTHDSRGNISRKIETASGETNTWDYTYDADGQLTAVKENGVDEELYTYDVNGNRTGYEQPGAWSVLADYDAQDRLVQLGGTTYQFNADGQLTQRGTDTFQYSAQGELLQATVEGQSITYTYDGTGRRVARTDSTGTTQYLYGNQSNPFLLTAMRDPAGVLSNFYYDNVGSLFAVDKGGVRYYVAADRVGTPKVVTDATGAVVKFLGFDSFGMPTFDSNPDFNLPVGFAGGLTDDKTGLVRFGYRDYEPSTGRWTAKDPIFFGGGQGNLYAYVQNNPVNWTDPLGLQATVAAPGAIPIFIPPDSVFQPGSHDNNVFVQSATELLQLFDPRPLADAISNLLFKEKGTNWATEQAKRDAEATGKTPCEVLAKMLDDAKCGGDRSKVDAIIAAQKYMGCRNIQKRNSN